MVAPEKQTPCCCRLQRGPSLLFVSFSYSPKNLYLLHDAWKHTVFSYNFTRPLTPSAQMQYDLAATIHFGLWSGFNEFLLCCMCMLLGLALSFDPHRHQYVLEMHHLAPWNKDVEPLQKRSFVLYSVFGFGVLKSVLSAQHAVHIGFLFFVRLFVCFIFFFFFFGCQF